MINVYTEKDGDIWLGVACDEEAIYATTFAFDENEALHGLVGSIPFGVPFQRSEKNFAFADRVMKLIKDIYDGKGGSHKLRFETEHLSPYTRKVLEVTSLIPVGYVTSYGGVAKAAGGGPRAVGHVMATNPFAPIVPCHRVVASNFTLGGYGGGLDVKLDLLEREKRGYASEREVTVDGRKLHVFPVESVLRKLGKSKR